MKLNTFRKQVKEQMSFWVPKHYLQPYVEGAKKMRELDKLYYVWLACAVRVWQPRRILELGTLRGVSALAMFSELRTERGDYIITVDMESQKKSVLNRDITATGLRIVIGDDLDIDIFGDSPPVCTDMLFIDTEHTYEQISAEWKLYSRYLMPDTLVVVDDVDFEGVKKWWDERQCEKVLEHESHSTGWGYFFLDEKDVET
jgi:predicted O-methyltransferase YrrM